MANDIAGSTEQAGATIRVRGRDFTVTTQATKYDPKQYVLTGKRGAVYGTMRNVHRPELMFLISGSGRGACSLGEIWLTDKGGELRVVAS